MTTRWARFTRGWTAAAVSVFVALCSHALAGGGIPSVVGVVLCLAFAGMACVALAGRTLSLLRLSLSVGFSQFLFHGAFSLLGAPSASASGGSMTSTMQVHALHLQPNSTTGMVMSGWMWIAHAIAAVVTIAALRYGEGAFWGVLALARPFVIRMLAAFEAQPRLRHARCSVIARELLPRPRFVVLPRSLRGPPCSPAF